MHWSLVCVNVPQHSITYFDSQRTLNRRCPKVGVVCSKDAILMTTLLEPFLSLSFCFTAHCQIPASGGNQERTEGVLHRVECLFQNGRVKGEFDVRVLCVSESMREIRNKREWKSHFVYVLLTLLSLECFRMWQGRTTTVIVELLSFRLAFFPH